MMRNRLAALGVAALAGFAAAPAAMAQGTIKFGFVSSLSGPFTPWGVNVRDGMKMAIEELNDKGGVLGRRLELVERDDKNSPAEAITALRFLAEREGIVAGGGVISSDVALAVSREAETLKLPYFLSMAGSHAILKKDSRHTFRTCIPAAPENMGVVASLIRERKISRVGVILADYAWGHAIREGVEEKVKPIAGVRLQIEVAPVPEKDFTPYLRRLQALDPELIIASGHPPGLPTIVRQAVELGMKAQVVGSYYPTDLMPARAGEEVVIGRYVDYTCVDFEHPAYRALAERYFKAYKRLFDHAGFSGYVMVRMVADAIHRTKSTDPKTIAEAIRKGSFDQPGYGWPLSYTEWGEMSVAKPILYTYEKGDPGAINPGATWRPRVIFRSPVLPPYVPKD